MPADFNPRFADSAAAQERFLSLFLRSELEIFRYVAALVPNPTDAEDIVQQTAMALWQKFDAYDPAQPFTPWACRFALNKALHWIERRQRWQALLEHGLAEELAQRRQELQPEFEPRLKHLEVCVGKLPPTHRSLVEAYYYERTDIDSLAGRSGKTVAATARSADTAFSSRFPISAPLQWKSTGGLVKPVSDAAHDLLSVKDPTVVRYDQLPYQLGLLKLNRSVSN